MSRNSTLRYGLASCACLLMLLPTGPGFAQDKAEKTVADTSSVEALMEFNREPVAYRTEGHRDPFASLAPKETDTKKKIKELFNYEDSLIKGIVSADEDLYALAVDKDGLSYVLRESDRVYGGRVRKITRDTLYLSIVKYGRAMTIILRMESSKSTVITEVAEGSELKKPGINITYGKNVRMKDNVMIEDVTIPSLSTRTLDEQWFGDDGDKSAAGTGDATESPMVVALLDPVVESWIELPYILDWTTIDGEKMTYELILDDNEDFSSPLLTEKQLPTSSFILSPDAGLPANRNLYWRITAHDGSGDEYTCNQRYGTFKIIGNQ